MLLLPPCVVRQVCKEVVYWLSRSGKVSEQHESRNSESPLVCVATAAFRASMLLKVPISLQDRFGEMLDSLSHCQRMLLKVAGVIGEEFDGGLLHKAYPIEDHVDILESEFKELLEIGIVISLRTAFVRQRTRKCLSSQPYESCDGNGGVERERRRLTECTPPAHAVAGVWPRSDAGPMVLEDVDDEDESRKPVFHCSEIYTFGMNFLCEFMCSRLLRAQSEHIRTRLPRLQITQSIVVAGRLRSRKSSRKISISKSWREVRRCHCCCSCPCCCCCCC